MVLDQPNIIASKKLLSFILKLVQACLLLVLADSLFTSEGLEVTDNIRVSDFDLDKRRDLIIFVTFDLF